jgi:hypothetical protein
MRKGKIKAILFIVVFLLVMATAITLLLDMEREKKEVESLGYDPYRATPAPTVAPTVTPMPVSTIMPTPVPPTPFPPRKAPCSLGKRVSIHSGPGTPRRHLGPSGSSTQVAAPSSPSGPRRRLGAPGLESN